nr:type IV toxin-antitoxin system AbiEi family antitoxin domain-containing protein [Micromonospora sp. DSM 115978]
MGRLSEVAQAQWGLVTARQSRTAEVSRVDVARLVDDGALERVAPGVYRLVGVPPHPDLDGIRAAWLQLDPGAPTEGRRRRPDAVASHRSAAAVLGLGDLLPDVHQFYVVGRRQLRREDVQTKVRRDLPRSAGRVVDGLPVTTAARTVADLLAAREDESAVSRIVQDGLRAQLLSLPDVLVCATTA